MKFRRGGMKEIRLAVENINRERGAEIELSRRAGI